MTDRLKPIIEQKKREVALLQTLITKHPQHAIADLLCGKVHRQATKRFKQALGGERLSVIAEIKRQSPSKGVIAAIPDPVALANRYVLGGASAISVLTDHVFFAGQLVDLQTVSAALSTSSVPVLRKDFIIEAIQIAEAVYAGADAVLAIVAVLGHRTKDIIQRAHEMGLEVLVEVHDERELELALNSGAEIIGVNNRNLTNFAVDEECAMRLLEDIPKEIIRVAESGIVAPLCARAYHRAGFDAVLIGEALVRSHCPESFIEACRDE